MLDKGWSTAQPTALMFISSKEQASYTGQWRSTCIHITLCMMPAAQPANKQLHVLPQTDGLRTACARLSPGQQEAFQRVPGKWVTAAPAHGRSGMGGIQRRERQVAEPGGAAVGESRPLGHAHAADGPHAGHEYWQLRAKVTW